MPTVQTTDAKQARDILNALAYRIERGASFQIIMTAEASAAGTVTHVIDWTQVTAEKPIQAPQS